MFGRQPSNRRNLRPVLTYCGVTLIRGWRNTCGSELGLGGIPTNGVCHSPLM
jgi:hypothetical protein